MVKRTIPLATMEKILKNCGADRVADKAKAELRDILEDYALDVGTIAVKLATHAGRKTVKESDIKLATK